MFAEELLANSFCHVAKDWDMRETQRPRGPVGPIGPRWYQSLSPSGLQHICLAEFSIWREGPLKDKRKQTTAGRSAKAWLRGFFKASLQACPLEFVPITNLSSVLAAVFFCFFLLYLTKGHDVTMCDVFLCFDVQVLEETSNNLSTSAN